MPYFKAADQSLHFLEDAHFAYLLPPGCAAITDAAAHAMQQVPAPVSTVPQVVTRRQAMLALLAAGKLDAVDQIIQAAPKAVQITWETAQDFERNNPLIDALAPQIGLADADIDNLFIEAAKL